jgi:hypothetical protein
MTSEALCPPPLGWQLSTSLGCVSAALPCGLPEGRSRTRCKAARAYSARWLDRTGFFSYVGFGVAVRPCGWTSVGDRPLITVLPQPVGCVKNYGFLCDISVMCGPSDDNGADEGGVPCRAAGYRLPRRRGSTSRA